MATMKIVTKNTVLGEDDEIYTPGKVIEVEESRAKFLIAMRDAVKAEASDKLSDPPAKQPTRSSMEAKAVAVAVSEAIKAGTSKQKDMFDKHEDDKHGKHK